MRVSTPVRSVLLALALAAPLLAQGPDRSTPPTPGPPPDLDLPPIQTRQLAGGLAVWIVEMHEVPVVQLALVVRSGAGADPAGRFGVASLTAAMLDEGAGDREALQIADEIDVLGASLTTDAGFDASTVRLSVPVERLPQALPIMADVALRPTFPAGEVDRLRRERLTAMLQARDNPSAVAAEAFPGLLYGRDHRYGVGSMGTAASLAALSRDDLAGFHAAHFRPDNAVLIVAGDVTPDALMPQLEQAFGGWSAGARAAAAPPVAAAKPPATRRVVIVDKPGAAQSQIRIGTIGVPRDTPDYFPLTLVNTALGGSFTSRLNQNLREEHGYAYGAASVFQMRRAAGPFMALAGVQTDKTAEALAEFFKELNGIREPIPAAEFTKVQNYLALGFPADFESTGDLVRQLQELAVYGLPRDYYEHYIGRLRAVTVPEAARVARERIVPDRMLVVVVGDRATIEAPVRALGLGPVEVRSIDDVLGPPPAPAN